MGSPRNQVRSVLAALLVFAAEASAFARPQWNTALIPSGCVLGNGEDLIQSFAFCGAARADVLFARERTADFGFGPYLAVGTAAFDDLRLTAGGSLLLPVLEDFPLVVSAGALLRDGTETGLDTSVFWGVRSYNFHGDYNFAGGLVLDAQRGFGRDHDVALSVGLQVDGFILAVPFLLAIGALQ